MIDVEKLREFEDYPPVFVRLRCLLVEMTVGRIFAAMVIAFGVLGCKSTPKTPEQYARDRAQYEANLRAWRADDARSQQLWNSATSGEFNGGGTPLPKPKPPSR